jgi:transposase
MGYIKGEDREQTILFPASIDDYIDGNSTVRVIDAFVSSLDLSEMKFIRYEPNETGRPPYDPKDILRLYIYGYMNRIRSSRRLETESKRNLEVIWLMQKLTPDHKTIANFRKDNKKALKSVFKEFVKICIDLELYGKELAAIDGSKFKAVNSKARNFSKDKLGDRIARIDGKIDEYLKELDEIDKTESLEEKEKSISEIQNIVKDMKERKAKYETIAKGLEETGETQKSLTDSDSRLMLANGKMDVCYNVQTAVDAKYKLIAEFEVTNNGNDSNQLTPMAVKAKEILGTETLVATADKGYAGASDVAAAIQAGVTPHIAGTDYDICIPVKEEIKTKITSHTNGKCVYIKERNIAICPMGNTLYPGFYKKSKSEAIFSNPEACKQCTCRCTKGTHSFQYQIMMKESDFSKEYYEKDLTVRQFHIKPDKEIYRQRKSLSEHPFGTIKRSMDAGYCLLKGKPKVTGEFALIFLAYNIKRVINILGSKKLMDFISKRAWLA